MQLSPARMKTFARCMIKATAHHHERKQRMQDIHEQIHKVRKYAANRHIRKETVKKEMDVLTEKLNTILDRERVLKLNDDQLSKLGEKELAELDTIKRQFTAVNQKITFADEQHTQDILMLMDRLAKMEELLQQVAKKLRVKAVQHQKIKIRENRLLQELREVELAMLEEQLRSLEKDYQRIKKRKGQSKTQLKQIQSKISTLKKKIQKAKMT